MIIKAAGRYEYLFQAFQKRGKTIFKAPIDNRRTTIIECSNYNIIWDFRDGIVDDAPREETTGFMHKFLEIYPNKPYVYVKINYSPKLCKNLDLFASETNGHVITCPNFSLYKAGTELLNQRVKLRKKIKRNTSKVLYAGKDLESYQLPSLYKGESKSKFRYPIDWREAKQLFGLTDSPQTFDKFDVFDRKKQIAAFQNKIKDNFVNMGKVNLNKYFSTVLDGTPLFQPTGVGVRHLVWEAMALGIPSILYDTSYLSDEQKKHVVIIDNEMSADDIFEKTNKLSSEKIIDFFEKTMTPDKIVDHVLNESERLLG